MNRVKENFDSIYREFRLELYKRVFEIVRERDGSLSATEYFSAEVIFLLQRPTVTEFADFLEISSPNAAYKVKSLIAKGYVVKLPTEDGRTFLLDVTEKFRRYYHEDRTYGSFIFGKISEELNDAELHKVDTLLEMILEKVKQVKRVRTQSDATADV